MHKANSSVANTSTISSTHSTTTITEATTRGEDSNLSNKILVPTYNETSPTESGYIKKEISLRVIYFYSNIAININLKWYNNQHHLL